MTSYKIIDIDFPFGFHFKMCDGKWNKQHQQDYSPDHKEERKKHTNGKEPLQKIPLHRLFLSSSSFFFLVTYGT